MYCYNCINSIEYSPTSDNFICEHCKTNVILCNVKSNTQTKKLNIIQLHEYEKCLQILNFLLLDV